MIRACRPLPRLAALAALLGAVFASPADARQIGPSIVVDAATGQVLQADRAGAPWFPASLTKMMTLYVTLNQVREGRLALDTGLRVSPRAAAAAPSKMRFRAGSIVRVDNALAIIMVRSANDVSVTLAEGVGGSVDRFVQMMNAEAQRLGMTGTRFVNPHGLPAAAARTTARDMAVLARALLREHSQHAGFWRIPAIRYGAQTMRNTNHLIGRYAGADGMKTGFICASGFNVVATASRGGRQLITVVLGSTSARSRAETAARLFERNFHAQGVRGLAEIVNEGGAPPDIRGETCRRRGPRGPVLIETGEEFEAEPATAEDAANLNVAMLAASPGARRRAPSNPFGMFAASAPGADGSALLHPFRMTSEPVVVYLGGARGGPPAPPPAAAVAATAPVAPIPGRDAPRANSPGAIPTVTLQTSPAPATAAMGAIRAGTPQPNPAAPPQAGERLPGERSPGERSPGALAAVPPRQNAAPTETRPDPSRPGAIVATPQGPAGRPLNLLGAAPPEPAPAARPQRPERAAARGPNARQAQRPTTQRPTSQRPAQRPTARQPARP